jgi:Saxitoxin biosynthesis operon protein SxtJ
VQWSDVIAKPKPRVLRQFAGLWMVFFSVLAAGRAWRGHADLAAAGLAALAVIVGVLGLVRPEAVRFIYTGWMAAAFPIGWTVSQVMLVVLFFVVFTPVALVFRMMGRDPLRLRRPAASSYWTLKPRAMRADEYFRQS